jgi:hypothetical protein
MGSSTGSWRPSCAKFFSRGESGGAAITERANTREKPSGARNPDAAVRQQTWQKSAFHRYFRIMSKLVRLLTSAQNIFAWNFAGDHAASVSQQRAAALTHKIKRSHCYFFSTVVIGW